MQKRKKKENMDVLILYWSSVKAIIVTENAEICIPRGRSGKIKSRRQGKQGMNIRNGEVKVKVASIESESEGKQTVDNGRSV